MVSVCRCARVYFLVAPIDEWAPETIPPIEAATFETFGFGCQKKRSSFMKQTIRVASVRFNQRHPKIPSFAFASIYSVPFDF